METDDTSHAGQLLASNQRDSQRRDGHPCEFCGTTITDDATDSIEHHRNHQTNHYCSPSCFIRQMERIGGIASPD